MPSATKSKKSATKATAKAAPAKPIKKAPVVVVEQPQEQEPIRIENTSNSARMTAIHHMWDLLQSSPMTADQLAQQVAARLVKVNKMESDAAAKLAATAINHQLPYETGQKGRKSIRVRTIKGGKLEWIGGAIRRRKTA